ncbi:MAG: hypothetical protein MJE77_08055 [Proteobacteria bacterium]|nr:hypothetical protein [Pseudomonadota bacterium]
MQSRPRQNRTATGLIALVAMFAILCGVIGLLISTFGPAAGRDSPGIQDSVGALDSTGRLSEREAIERALERIDRAAAALSRQNYDESVDYIEQARNILRRADKTGSADKKGDTI